MGEWVSEQCQSRSERPRNDRFGNQDFFDHILRNDESYIQKWEHVQENSVRAELVARTDDWPYQGEFVFIHRP